jgi:hypothetical protein
MGDEIGLLGASSGVLETVRDCFYIAAVAGLDIAPAAKCLKLRRPKSGEFVNFNDFNVLLIL